VSSAPIEEAGWGPEPVFKIWSSEKFLTLLGLKIRPQSPIVILAPQDFAVSKLNLSFFELYVTASVV
jgi:hypothetical protein